MSPNFDLSGDPAAVDPHTGHPGEIFTAAGHAIPPPPVGEERAAGELPPDRAEPSAACISRSAFLALVAYASLITAVCLGLLYFVLTNRERQLESLPDVVPPRSNGEISRILVPPGAVLPPGHVLSLGESSRFGDLLVTALKVTREPLEFSHYRGEGRRPPAGEVLKLWLKLDNVSRTGQAFMPLDADLLFYRAADRTRGLRANNFLVVDGERSPDRLIPIYDQPPDSDWDLTGQNLSRTLKPGESVVTYVPTTTDLPDLRGLLKWRVQLRKGIATNGWGVTTLVEVTCRADDVEKS